MKLHTAAIITIKDADRMTDQGRRSIASWMRKQAQFLEEEGHNYSGGFRARYQFPVFEDERKAEFHA